MNEKTVRTRFAPSPTGMLHIGAVRTAMFAWLIARRDGGQFILRIEDTDRNRLVDGAEQNIIDSLQWLGIDQDEGPVAGGEYGPYRQSERLEIYKKWADQLIESGTAYVDTTTPEQVQAWRQDAQEKKKPFLFRDYCDDRHQMVEHWYGKYPLRFRIDKLDRVEWFDEVRGDLSAGPESLDDFIVIKADKFPTYNFAYIVDDAEMQITHVVRGEEFISSTPKYIRLYEALGVEQPKLVTVPPILGKNGGKKLSKRDGAKGVFEYRSEGYTVDSIWNFLCMIGWNDGTTDEIFSRNDLVERFSIDRIQKSAGRFEIDRLDWISGHHIRRMDTHILFDVIAKQEQAAGVKFWPDEAYQTNRPLLESILALVQDKLKRFDELAGDVDIFFGYEEAGKNRVRLKPELTASKDLLTKLFEAEQSAQIVYDIRELLADDNNFRQIEFIEKALRDYVAEKQLHTGKVFRLIRAALTGREVAPGLFETMHVLGQADTLERLDTAVRTLDS